MQCTGKVINTVCVFACVTPVVFSFLDQQQLDEEIKALRKGLKEKVNRLNEIQGASSLLCSLINSFCAQSHFLIDTHLQYYDIHVFNGTLMVILRKILRGPEMRES